MMLAPDLFKMAVMARVAGLETAAINEALAGAGGVQSRAARTLGISERALRYKMSKYGMKG